MSDQMRPVDVEPGQGLSRVLRPGLQIVALSQLHESPDNPREISDERYEALKYSLKSDPEMLQARPMIADADGELVCGNMRHRAMVEIGWTEASVFIKTEWKPGQKREWMLRDNQEYGDWVPEELAAMVAAHSEEDGDMRLLGFSESKTDNLLKLARSESNGGNSGADNEDTTPPEMFAVIVECESEDQQAQLIEELSGRGHDVRALLS